MNDRRITIREVADDVGISIGSCHENFSNVLGMKRVAEKFVPHTSLLVRKFLAKNNTLTMPQPPYSRDMAPGDFFLFPKMKRTLKGQHFTAIYDIKGVVRLIRAKKSIFSIIFFKDTINIYLFV